jgi:hypothetical protein
VSPRAGLEGYGKSRPPHPPTGIRSPDRPARSESLYRLSYPGPPAAGAKEHKTRQLANTSHLLAMDPARHVAGTGNKRDVQKFGAET